MENKSILAEDNIKLVYYVISREYPSYLHDDDIIQSGMLGLCLAANNWKGESSFSTYAIKCIRGEINKEFVRRKPYSKNKSFETKVAENLTLEDTLVGNEDVVIMDDSFYKQLSSFQQEVMEMNSMGYNTFEIADYFKCSVQKIQKVLRTIKLLWGKFNEED